MDEDDGSPPPNGELENEAIREELRQIREAQQRLSMKTEGAGGTHGDAEQAVPLVPAAPLNVSDVAQLVQSIKEKHSL